MRWRSTIETKEIKNKKTNHPHFPPKLHLGPSPNTESLHKHSITFSSSPPPSPPLTPRLSPPTHPLLLGPRRHCTRLTPPPTKPTHHPTIPHPSTHLPLPPIPNSDCRHTLHLLVVYVPPPGPHSHLNRGPPEHDGPPPLREPLKCAFFPRRGSRCGGGFCGDWGVASSAVL